MQLLPYFSYFIYFFLLYHFSPPSFPRPPIPPPPPLSADSLYYHMPLSHHHPSHHHTTPHHHSINPFLLPHHSVISPSPSPSTSPSSRHSINPSLSSSLPSVSRVECCESLRPSGDDICPLGPECGNRVFEKKIYAKVSKEYEVHLYACGVCFPVKCVSMDVCGVCEDGCTRMWCQYGPITDLWRWIKWLILPINHFTFLSSFFILPSLHPPLPSPSFLHPTPHHTTQHHTTQSRWRGFKNIPWGGVFAPLPQ